MPRSGRRSTYETDRCYHVNDLINPADLSEKEKIHQLEEELLPQGFSKDSYFIPPFQIDCGCRLLAGKKVFANHGLLVMSPGTVTIEDGVVMGPEVALLTVNHKPFHLRVVHAKEIHIKKGAWLGGRVTVLPGVTIGENAIVGACSVVTKDIPDNSVAVGNPAKVIKYLK